MEWWHVLVVVGLVVARRGALHGLHRVCLWLEARGFFHEAAQLMLESPVLGA
jgi:hypothetical protein